MDSNGCHYDTREVITLQAGPLTNCVCAHYWNYLTDLCAKPYQPNSVIRPQTLLDGNSYSWRPRAVSVDFTDSVDYGLSCDNVSSANGSSTASYPPWNGRVDEIRRSTITTENRNNAKRTDFNGSSPATGKQITHGTQWNVCLSSHLRQYWMNMNNGDGPVCRIPEYLTKYTKTVENNDHCADYLSSLPSYAQGRDLIRTGSVIAEDFEDRVRRMAERCDSPSAFQLLTDAETGFTGVANRMLDYVVDEFPKRAIFTVPIYQTAAFSQLRIERRYQLMSKANQLALLVRLESPEWMPDSRAWLPLDVSVFSPKLSSCLATGLTAACLDSLTTPVRLAEEHKGIRMEDLVSGRRLAAGGRVRRLVFCIQSVLKDCAVNLQMVFDLPLSPLTTRHMAQMLSARFGFIDITNTDCPLSLQWKVISPYFIANSDLNNGAPSSYYEEAASFYRQLVLRGITEDEPTIRRLMQSASLPAKPSNGVTTSNWWLPLHSSVNSIHSFTAASNLCIQRRTPAPFCDQPTRVCAASLLDSPSPASPDVAGLVQLVEVLLQQDRQQRSHLSSQSPIDGMENDLWLDCLERARSRLLDTYSVLDRTN